MPDMRPNLYIIGFMGVGKSAVGRLVARQLGHRFIDSDAAIEEREGRSIREIFGSEGESRFRELELDFLRNGHPRSECVVACGGGLPMAEDRRTLLLEGGIVVCLFASVDTILKRTAQSTRRPLLDAENPEERIRTLLREREPVYMATGIGISAEGRSLDDVARNVVRIYRRESKSRSREKAS